MLKSRFFWKIYLTFIFFIILTSIFAASFIVYHIGQEEMKDTQFRLQAYANLFIDYTSELQKDSSPILEQRVQEIHHKLGVRLTVVRKDGVVIADSDEMPSKMENHSTRPEIQEAKDKGVGVITRFSQTLQKNMMYVAVPINNNGELVGYSRASLPLTDIKQKLARLTNIGIASVSIGGVIALLLGIFLARQIVYPLSKMTRMANSVAGGNYEQQMSVKNKNEFAQLAAALNAMSSQIKQDITMREKAETELQKAHDELEQQVQKRTSELTETNNLLKEQIIEREIAEKILQSSEERYYLASKATNDIIYEFDILTQQLTRNENGQTIFGYLDDEISPNLEWWKAHVHSEDRQKVFNDLEKALAEGRKFWSAEYRFCKADGSYAYLFDRGYIVYDQNNIPTRMIGAMSDFTQRKQAEESLRTSEVRYRDLIENANDIIFTTDLAGQFISLNKAGEKLTGYSQEQARQISYFSLAAPEHHGLIKQMTQQNLDGSERSNYEIDILRTDGQRRTLEISSRIIFQNSVPIAVQGIARDISERKWAETQLKHHALHDSLTGLPNRALLLNHLKMAIDRKRRHSEYQFAVLFIDIDRFKVINDSLGHLIGDKLLISLADRLKQCIRVVDTVARFGGDEFILLLEDINGISDAIHIAERVLAELSTPFYIDGHDIFSSASIGVAFSETGYELPEELLRDADTAMYRAKSLGKACYHVFDPEMHIRASNLLKIETDLRRALERKEFELHYQPIISLENGRLIEFEALLRWRHPERGMIMPAEFIPIAEDTGLIVPIGHWVINEACRQLKQWQSAKSEVANLLMSVNLSAKQLTRLDFPEQVKQILEKNQISPHCLNLEITESAIMENSIVAENILRQLKDLGIRLTTDDFGTGYSSLSYLHRFPIDRLKIDRSFVWGMTSHLQNAEIVRTILMLARSLKMEVVAEGIETEQQLSILKELDCEYGQGYIFSKPVDAQKAKALIEQLFFFDDFSKLILTFLIDPSEKSALATKSEAETPIARKKIG